MAGAIIQLYKVHCTANAAEPSAELFFQVRGTESETEADALCAANIPLVFQGVNLNEYTYEHIGGGVWEVTARYNWQEDVFSFDTTGGTARVYQSKETVGRYAIDPYDPPDFKGAINVGKDSVEGVDVVSPQFQFAVQSTFGDAQVTTAYQVALADLTGKTNNALFRGFQIGEVLFLGASGSKRGSLGRWELNFKFGRSANAIGLACGDVGKKEVNKEPGDDKVFAVGDIVYLNPDDQATDEPGLVVNTLIGPAMAAVGPGDTTVTGIQQVTKVPGFPGPYAQGDPVFLTGDGLAWIDVLDPRDSSVCTLIGNAHAASPAPETTVFVERVFTKKPGVRFSRGQNVYLTLGDLGTDQPYEYTNPPYGRALEASAAEDNSVLVSIIAKKGWEYLWVLYVDAESEGYGVKQPQACFVERVYDSADLGDLLIPV